MPGKGTKTAEPPVVEANEEDVQCWLEVLPMIAQIEERLRRDLKGPPQPVAPNDRSAAVRPLPSWRSGGRLAPAPPATSDPSYG